MKVPDTGSCRKSCVCGAGCQPMQRETPERTGTRQVAVRADANQQEKRPCMPLDS